MTPDTREHSAVAVYASHTAAEAAVRALQRAGVDLEQLDQGVRRALGTTTPMGSVLPRKAVHEGTWREILARLPVPHVQTTGAGQ